MICAKQLALGTIISHTRLLFIILASGANSGLMGCYCELVSGDRNSYMLSGSLLASPPVSNCDFCCFESCLDQ